MDHISDAAGTALMNAAAGLGHRSNATGTAMTCSNVLEVWPALWGLIKHPGVEPTNAAAEQALRGMCSSARSAGPPDPGSATNSCALVQRA